MNLLTRSALTSHALTSLTMAKLAETATGRRGLNRHLLFKGSYHSVNISRWMLWDGEIYKFQIIINHFYINLAAIGETSTLKNVCFALYGL